MDVIEQIEKVRERNRKEYEALAKMTGRTIAEIEADLTAPDPSFTDDEGDATSGLTDFRRIVEGYMPDATAYFHSIAPDMAESVIRKAVGVAVANAALREDQQFMCPSCRHSEAWPGHTDRIAAYLRRCMEGYMPNCGRCSHWEALEVPPDMEEVLDGD